MEMIGIALAAIAAVPALGWLYVRTIGKRHTIDFHHGNMSLAKVVSTNPRHNDKLALVTVGLTFTNGGPHPLTIKDVVLQYKFRGKKKAELVRVSTGSVQGDECVLTVNADAAIVIVWKNLRDELPERRLLQKGATIDGSGIFILEAPPDQYGEVYGFVLIVRDYSGGKSRHKLSVGPDWYKGIEDGMVLMDAPVHEHGQNSYSWEGITI